MTNLRPFVCPECGLPFEDLRDYLQHVRYHAELCAYCSDLATHRDEHDRPECDHCRDLPVDAAEIAFFGIDDSPNLRVN
jgi:hypothetical protein